jgi:hypothetical protein
VPLVGSVAWIAAGRPATRPGRGYRGDRLATVITDADISEFMTEISPADADGMQDLRRRCRERAQEQRRRYAEQQRAARPATGTNGATGTAGAAD